MLDLTPPGLTFDGTTTHGIVPYKVASIKRSAEIVLVMDGVQIQTSPDANSGQPDNNFWGASATAYSIDGWRLLGLWFYSPDWLLSGTVTRSGTVTSDDGQPINPGFNRDASNIDISVQASVIATNGGHPHGWL